MTTRVGNGEVEAMRGRDEGASGEITRHEFVETLKLNVSGELARGMITWSKVLDSEASAHCGEIKP